MKTTQIFFMFMLIICTSATLLDLDIKSTIHFTRQFTDISVLKTNVNFLKHKVLSFVKEEKILASHYTPRIDEKTREVFKKISVQQNSFYKPDTSIDEQNSLFVSLADYFDIIRSLFNSFTSHLNGTVDDASLCSLPWVNGIPEGTNMVHGLQSIQQLAMHTNFITLFNNVMNNFNYDNCLVSKQTYCDIGIPLPEKLVAIYHLMSAIERKYFVMDTFVNLINIACNNGVNAHKVITAQEVLIKTVQGFLKSLKSTVRTAERGIYYCDRTKYPEDYIELEGFKRMVVIHKRDHSADNSCFLSCQNINDDSLSVSDADFSARSQFCPGRLINCKSGGDMEICHMPEGSSKLYQWIKNNDNGAIYGNKTDCLGHVEIMESYKFEVHSNFICEPCMCICVTDLDQSKPRSGVSLKAETSNIANNEAIIGIRLIKIDGIIYIQIEIGKVLSGNRIEENSNRWKDVSIVGITNNMIDVNFQTDEREFIYAGDAPHDFSRFIFGRKYLKGSSIVTGVKFVVLRRRLPHMNYDVNIISMAIQATHYDVKSGKLGAYPSSWIISDPSEHDEPCNRYKHRRELRFPNSDNPLNDQMVYLDSISGDYATFWASDVHKDLGQTTVPLFDATPMFGNPTRFLVGGLSMDHKAALESGGFISLNIATVDYVGMIEDTIPTEDKIDLNIIFANNTI